MRKLAVSLILFICCLGVFFQDGKASAASFSVNGNQTYTYEIMKRDIQALAASYPELIRYKSVGKSEYGRDIYAVAIGKGPAEVFVNGSHHAREWMTTSVNMVMIDQYAKAYYGNKSINGLPARSILDKTTMWFIPMVNPDGVTLQQSGINSIPAGDRSAVLKMNEGSYDFKRWKANGKGVDLNRQYDAKWSTIVSNPGKPYWQNYKGKSPASAAEVKVVLNFLKTIDAEMSVSYHSSGEILFWNFYQTGSRYTRDQNYAKQLGRMTGYRLVYPGPNPSGGGFTDWFLHVKKRPAFTLEISPYAGNTHVPLKNFNSIWEENKDVGLYIAKEGYNLYQQREGKTYDAKVAQVSSYLSSTYKLRPYYSSNIQSTANLYIMSTLENRYSASAAGLKKAEQLAASLPSYYRETAQRKINDAKQIHSKTGAFMEAVRSGDDLTIQRWNVESFMKKGTLNDAAVNEYHKMLDLLRKEEIAIGKVYTRKVRDLFGEKYLLPAKITRDTIQFEMSQYKLLKSIIGLKQSGASQTVINEKIAVYDRLKARGISSKKEWNQKYPGQYPDIPGFETVLQQLESQIR
ncbi:M14 family zinc carboxypeptidase [Metabacillus sp. 84]|uniref:M14 family zinc carboxypeptidase n=1 Tax=Metabacillus sp. 84 TaxID=3404705 RepID=UPI003CF803AB